MQKLFKQNKSRLVGIDIRSSAIKLLEFGDINGRILVKQGTLEPLSKRNSRRKITGAAVALSGTSVFSKELIIERGLSQSEIEEALWIEAKKAVNHLPEECYLDYHCVGTSAADPHHQHWQIVACRKETVDQLMEDHAAAKIKPQVVDVDYFALQRAAGLFSDQLPHHCDQSTLAILNLEATGSTFVVFRGEELLFTRSEILDNATLLTEATHYLGGKDWLRGYAEKAKNHSGLRLGLVKKMAPSIIQQLSQTLKFYYSSGHDPLDQLILGGECAVVPELAVCIQEDQQLPVMVANPFVNLSFSSEVDGKFLEAVAPAFMLCSGLALRKHPNEFH